jgi:hypothetical protein
LVQLIWLPFRQWGMIPVRGALHHPRVWLTNRWSSGYSKMVNAYLQHEYLYENFGYLLLD